MTSAAPSARSAPTPRARRCPRPSSNSPPLASPCPPSPIDGTPRPLTPAVEHALFRAAQEGLTNIRKHARATNAVVRLDFREPSRVRLELADNGVGANGTTAPASA
jgi:hypothetical protein